MAETVLERPVPAPGAGTPGPGEALRWGGLAWLILRAIASLAAWQSPRWFPGGSTVAVPGYTAPQLHGLAGVLAGSWLRADTLWYLKVATHGYGGDHGSFAFLPLFPLLVRGVMPLVGNRELYAALLVANLSCFLGFAALYELFRRWFGPSVARPALLGLALFPTSFFLVAPYAEPVLLAAGAAALLAAAKGRPGLAALAGALAALSRPFGVLLAVPLAGFAILYYRRGSGEQRGWWLAPLGPVVGVAAWMGWSAYQLGSVLGPVRVQSLWQRTASLPWVTLASGVRTWYDWRGSSIGPYELLDLGATLFGLALVVAALLVARRRRMHPLLAVALSAYGLAVMTACLASPFLPRPLMSMPRFVLALFPLFFAYAALPRWSRIPLALLSAGGLAWATALFVGARPIF